MLNKTQIIQIVLVVLIVLVNGVSLFLFFKKTEIKPFIFPLNTYTWQRTKKTDGTSVFVKGTVDIQNGRKIITLANGEKIEFFDPTNQIEYLDTGYFGKGSCGQVLLRRDVAVQDGRTVYEDKIVEAKCTYLDESTGYTVKIDDDGVRTFYDKDGNQVTTQ